MPFTARLMSFAFIPAAYFNVVAPASVTWALDHTVLFAYVNIFAPGPLTALLLLIQCLSSIPWNVKYFELFTGATPLSKNIVDF